MVKTLVKHGNSYALIIDKPIMDLLKLTPETPLEITTDGRMLHVGPDENPERRKKIETAAKKVARHYKPLLKRLA
jgi:antitoxin MazE